MEEIFLVHEFKLAWSINVTKTHILNSVGILGDCNHAKRQYSRAIFQ
jgi:hypothetical protein